YARDAVDVATLLDEAGNLADARSIYAGLAKSLGNAAEALERARVLTKLARVDDVLGDREGALATLAIAEREFRDKGEREDLLVTLGERAQILTREGKPGQAEVARREAMAIAMDLGDQYNMQSLLVSEAETLIDQDELRKAEDRLREAEQICVKL